MAKKKTDDLDYTNQPQATTADEVNNQDARTRLWQSLSYGYNNQLKQSNKAYDQAYSQADRQALSRGMQRSSYTNQTLANINQQKIDAQNNINSALIADYQNRIGDIENQEKEDERWERQFAETQKQNEWQRNYQESEAARSQQNWEKEYEANRADTTWNQSYQMQTFDYGKEQDALNRAFQQEQFGYQKEQDAANRAFQQEQFNYGKEQDAANRAFQQEQWEYGKEQDAYNQAFQREQYEYGKEQDTLNREFQQKQWEAQQEQWREEFEYSKMSDSQKLAYNYIVAAAANGGDVSDELLKQAGISRQDYNAMKAQAQSSGGGYGGYSKKTTSGSDDTTTNPSATTDAGLMNILDNPIYSPTLTVNGATRGSDTFNTNINGVNKVVHTLATPYKPEEDKRK